MSADSEAMRRTMRLWSCGVTVVTTHHDQVQEGMTASSFTSISLDPPLVLVCLHKQTRTTRAIQESGVYAVSFLSADQEALASQFAGYTQLPEGADRFYNVATFTAKTGAPILKDNMAWLDCRVYGTHDGGTHLVFVGEVVATGHSEEPAMPLVYHNRAYRRFVQDDLT